MVNGKLKVGYWLLDCWLLSWLGARGLFTVYWLLVIGYWLLRIMVKAAIK